MKKNSNDNGNISLIEISTPNQIMLMAFLITSNYSKCWQLFATNRSSVRNWIYYSSAFEVKYSSVCCAQWGNCWHIWFYCLFCERKLLLKSHRMSFIAPCAYPRATMSPSCTETKTADSQMVSNTRVGHRTAMVEKYG